MMQSKKAQFYIFMAIILSVYALALVAPAARSPPESAFRGLLDNYLFEAPKVVNSALYSGTTTGAQLANFTDSYVAFSRSLEPKFGILYGYSHDGVTDIRSRMWEDANITAGRTSFMLKDASAQINSTDGFTAYVNRRAYVFNLSKESAIQALFVSRNERGANIFKG